MFIKKLTTVVLDTAAEPAVKKALCVSRADLVALNHFAELPQMQDQMIARCPDNFLSLPTTLQDRATCETDPILLQLLPYVVISRKDTEQYFVYCRGKGGAEARLHGNLSIGVGGHVDTAVPVLNDQVITGIKEVELALANHLVDSATRELQEEVGYKGFDDCLLFNDELVYDDTNPVGQVHLGMLMHLDIADPSVLGDLEHGIIEGSQWLDLEDLLKPFVYDRMENWSKIVVDRLSAQAVYSIAPK